MKTIPLTQGKVALVDDADYEAVMQFKWCAHKIGRCFYVARRIQKPDGKWTIQHLHRFLLPGVPQIDHEDGNGLNNQRYNLRQATHSQNHRGFHRQKVGTSSKFRGVTWDKQRQKWKAHITVDGKRINLGRFTKEEEAARAYDAAARKYFVDGFLQLNFP